MEKDPDYYWEFSNGTIVILPQGTEAYPNPVSVLNVRVPLFIVKSTDVYTALDKLIVFANQMGVPLSQPKSGYPYSFISARSRWVPRISISLKNPTIRACLDAIVKQDRNNSWKISPDGETLAVDINRFHNQEYMQKQYRKWRQYHDQKADETNRKAEEKILKKGFRRDKNGDWILPGESKPRNPRSKDKKPWGRGRGQ